LRAFFAEALKNYTEKCAAYKRRRGKSLTPDFLRRSAMARHCSSVFDGAGAGDESDLISADDDVAGKA